MNSTQQKSNIKLKIAILSVAAVAMANAFISPALAEIAKAFPEVSMTNIQLIMTFAMLGQFPFTLITGILGNRINNKILVLLGLISLIIGGILPYFLNKSITFLYIGSAFMGVGQGILLTMLSTLISKYFSGEERSQMFGWQNSFTNGGNMIMALIGGFLASTLWKNVYLATILCIPSLLLVLFWLPSEKEDSEKTTIKEKGSTIALSAIPVVILMLVFAIGFATIILNSAMLINDKGLGGADIAGLMVSLSGLVSVGGGLLYKYVMRISKSFILCVGALCLASGLFIGYFSSQIVIYFIGSALVYLGFTFGFSGCMDTISQIVKPSQISSSMGILMAMQSLGSMISPYVINGLTGIYTQVSAENAFKTGAIWSLGVAVFGFILGIVNKEKIMPLANEEKN